jgi:hypothetical protein
MANYANVPNPAGKPKNIPPAGTTAYGTKLETYDNSSPEVKALIRQLNSLASAETLDQHSLALKGFDEDVTLDTPFIYIQGRERIRVLASLAKFFLGKFEIEPKLVKISVPEGGATKGGLLDVDGILHWLPHRPWFLPLTLLLPKDIPIYADVSMGVKAHNDKVYFVSGKNHNLPHVPRLVRMLTGYFAGMAVSIVEPVYNNLREWYIAGVENVSSATTNVRATAAKGYDTVQDITGNAVDTVKDTTSNIIDTAQTTVQRGVDTAKQTVSNITSS